MLIGDRNNCGYYRVCLYNKNHSPSKQRFFRHRLVAEHFIPNPNNLKEVNHKDLILEHNYASNLEWVARKDNEKHSRIEGKKEYKPFEVLFDTNKIKKYNFKEELAKELGVNKQTVKHWLHGKNKGFKKYHIKSIEYIK